MKTDAEIKVLINDHFKAIDGREAGLNNDTIEAVFSFWKNNLGSELTIYRDTITSTTDQAPRIVVGFNVTKNGNAFTVSAPAKSWVIYQWAPAGGYYHIINEYTDQTTFSDTCNAAYDNMGTYFENVYTTIEKALEAEGDLFRRMAIAIRYVNDSSSTINGQDIPNEIRALKEISPVVKTYDNLTEYLTDIGQILYPNAERPPKPVPVVGPDGESYNFVINPTISAGGGEYKFYSRHPFCISKEITNSTGYSLLTAGKADDTPSGADTLYTMNTRQGTYLTYLSNVTGGASADGAVSGEWYQTGLSSWVTFPYNWSVWLTEAEATAANIPIFDTNEEALAYCLKSPVINAQDFPDAIRSLDTRYVGPDGNLYEYKWEANVYNGNYVFYSHYPFVYCTNCTSGSNYYLLTGVNDSNGNVALINLRIVLGTYNALVNELVYPTTAVLASNAGVVGTLNGSVFGNNWVWTVPISALSDTEGFSTIEKAYEAISGKYVGPNGNLYNYKNSITLSELGLYNFYTDNLIFVCDDSKQSGDEWYNVLTILKNTDNVDVIAKISTSSGSYNSSLSVVYPSSATGAFNKSPAVSYGQNEATCPYNLACGIKLPEITSQNITRYSTMKEAYEAIIGKYVGPDDVAYTYHYYGESIVSGRTYGVDSYSNVKLVARQSGLSATSYYYDGSTLISVASRQGTKYPYGQNIMWISGYEKSGSIIVYQDVSWSLNGSGNIYTFPSSATDQELIDYLTS